MIHNLSTLSTRLLLSWKQNAAFYYDIRTSCSVFQLLSKQLSAPIGNEGADRKSEIMSSLPCLV